MKELSPSASIMPSDLFSLATARLNGAFGEGSGPVILHGVRCTGLESQLFDCAHGGFELNSCAHNLDAGVECVEGKYSYSICTAFLATKFLTIIDLVSR